jgi:hypothetical protein
MRHGFQDVDARAKPGHDEREAMLIGITLQYSIVLMVMSSQISLTVW